METEISGASRQGRMHATTRINDSFLRRVEGPLLDRLVSRVPGGVKPDHLTWLGLTGAAMTFGGYLLTPREATFLWLASFGLVLNWVGDSLDGGLARHRNTPRHRYGFFIDHTADLFAQVLIGLGLAFSGIVRIETAMMALIAYLAAVALALIRERATGVLRITFLRIGPTEIRCALIALNVLLLVRPPQPLIVMWAPLSELDLLVLSGSVLALGALAVSAIGEGRRLAGEDP